MRSSARRLLGDWDVLSAVAVVILAIGAAQLVAGAFETGVTVDEPIQKDRSNAWLEEGWYVPSYWLADGEPDPADELSGPFVYGPGFAAISHIANAAVGNEAWGEISDSRAAYDIRHLVVALLAALAVAAAGAAVWLLTRSRVIALWAAAGLLAVPRFTGHAFFNIKDVPVACGYTLITVGLLFALLEEPGSPSRRRRRIAIAAAIAGGTLIGAGTRLSMWLPFALMLATYGALRLGQRYLGGIVRGRGTDVAVGAGFAVGLLAIAALYPNVAATPLTLLVESVTGSSGYPYEGNTLTAGTMLHETPPVWYLPVWFGGTYPLLLSALALLGAGAALRALVRSRGLLWGRRELGLVLVAQQAILLPLAVIVDGGVIYNGVRQHLYVIPAIAIFAGVGAWWLLGWARSRKSMRAWRLVAIGALSLALIVPMAAQSLLFPYNYTYVNPVAAIDGVNDRWETDYWWASYREALTRVPLGVPLRCSVRLDTPLDSDLEADFDECDGDRFDTAVDRRGTDVDPGSLDLPPAVWVLGRKREASNPPPYCEETDNVTRWMWGEAVTISFVLRCDLAKIAAKEREAAEGEG